MYGFRYSGISVKQIGTGLRDIDIPQFLRITAPFLLSTNPLSLGCLGLDLVKRIKSLFSNLATVSINIFAPIIRVKLADAEGELFQHVSNSGSKSYSVILDADATISH